MSNMLLQRPLDQKLENSSLEEIIFTTALFENTVRKRLYSLGEKFKSFQLSLCGLKKKLQPERQDAKVWSS